MIDAKKLVEIVRAIAERIEKEKDFLTQLDNEIGDGDHGINLARGFKSVEEKLPTFEDKDIVHLSDSPEDVVKKFQLSNRYNLIVVDDEGKYQGFLSRANTFSAYRRFISETSEE